MPGHLREQHKIPVNLGTFKEDAKALGIISTAQDFILPFDNGPPVEAISTHPGAACTAPNCSYAAPLEETVKSLIQKTHKGMRAEITHNITVQLLFSEFKRKYFIINPALSTVSSEPAFHHLMTNVIPSMPARELPGPTNMREVAPFHRVTRWWDLLGDNMADRKRRADVIDMARKPHHEEVGLRSLPLECESYLRDAMYISIHSGGFKVRQALVSTCVFCYIHAAAR